MSVRFLHGADFHLDSPFDGLSGEKAALRRREQRQLLERLGEQVRKWDAQLLFLSGDLLVSTNAFGETGDMLRTVLAGLGIPVFIAPGNHDWYRRTSPYARLAFSENVHIFTRPHLEPVGLRELGVRVWGAGYTDNTCPPLLRGFQAEKQPGILDILVLHGEVGRPRSPYCPMGEEELAASGMDYAALGHVHTFSGLRRAGNCYYAWPGCPEGRGFDECGEKGIIRGELTGESCRAEFVPLGGRRYQRLEVRVGEDPLESVLAALPEDTRRDIYRITLTGECAAAPDVMGIQSALEGRFFHLTVRDGTEPQRDLWARREEDGLRGQFLRRMYRRLEQARDEEERRTVILAVRAGLAAMEGREDRL